MGLPWFSLTMIAIDAIFISDRTWKRVSGSIRDKWRSTKLDPPADKDSADIDAADATTELVGEPIHTPAALLSLPD